MKRCIVLLLFFLIGFACKETPPEALPPSTLQLKAEDASCTEAWLKASTTQVPATVALLRDNQRVSVIGLRTSDSLLIDEGLLPRRTYTYQLQKLGSDSSSVVETSASVQLTTMDTTSHNFSWQIDTLGVTSSVLYDVAIINDTLAYAVGEMYLRDSTGQIDPILYNLAIWNGQQWRIQRISVPLCPNSTGFFPLRAVFAFARNDIWLSGGGEMIHWNGLTYQGDCSMNPLIQGAITKIWGTSSGNLYAVGGGGTIIHYNGTWQRVESGTTTDIHDIWGASKPTSSQPVVLCAVSNILAGHERLILQVNSNNTVNRIPWMQDRTVYSIWHSGGTRLLACGDGVHMRGGDGKWREIAGINVIPYFTEKIRGVSLVDLFVVGDFGIVAHYNGYDFRTYPNLNVALVYNSVAYDQGVMIAVGFVTSPRSRAIVVRGTR